MLALALAALSFGGGATAAPGDCVDPAQRAVIERLMEENEARRDPTAARSHAAPSSYSFYPQSGTLWQDLSVTNFVDLDPTAGIRDWDCTDITYDGHNGHDTGTGSFAKQAIGIPVYAALDGIVFDAHDGEFDMQTTASNVPANYVILDHGDSHYTWYWHFKKDSVAVTVGQVVTRGTQLGLTGSSGRSTGPHLHFESQYAGTVFEPYAGSCRPGPSRWASQVPIRRETYAKEFAFSTSTFSGNGGLPFDQAPRVGAFVQGLRTVYFRVELGVMPASSTYRIRYLMPGGAVAIDDTGTFPISAASRDTWWWWSYNLNLNVLGTWRLLLDVNGQNVVSAPFEVVASASQVVNRPPLPVSVLFDPLVPRASDALFCRVQTSLINEDPDYDILRYRYEWLVNGAPVRDVTSAGHSDALAKGRFAVGDVVTCRVTPSDGTLSAASAQVAANVDDDGLLALARPTVTAPAAGTTQGVSGVGFSWTAVAGTGYDLRIWSATTGKTFFSGSLSGSATSTLISLPDGSYRFAVRACSGGFGPASCGPYGRLDFAVSGFGPTGAPAVVTPAGGAALTSSTQALSWSAVAPNPALPTMTYEVVVTRLTDSTTALQINIPHPDTTTVFSFRSGSYRMRVRACQASCGPFSPPRDFTVALPAGPTAAPAVSVSVADQRR